MIKCDKTPNQYETPIHQNGIPYLRASPIHEVVGGALLLARDRRSTLAKNIDYVERITGHDAWVARPQLVRSIA